MPTRPKKRQKSSQKNSMSPPSVLEICRQPKSLIIGDCLALAIQIAGGPVVVETALIQCPRVM